MLTLQQTEKITVDKCSSPGRDAVSSFYDPLKAYSDIMAQHMTLPDGRNFEFFVSGAMDGFPLFWIHGTPGSYVPAAGIPEVCQEKGVKCITMSRAGYGESSRKIERSVIDCVPDIEALRDHLGIEEFIVGGWSGGGEFQIALQVYIRSD